MFKEFMHVPLTEEQEKLLKGEISVVVEGINGSGKDTFVNLLKEELPDHLMVAPLYRRARIYGLSKILEAYASIKYDKDNEYYFRSQSYFFTSEFPRICLRKGIDHPYVYFLKAFQNDFINLISELEKSQYYYRRIYNRSVLSTVIYTVIDHIDLIEAYKKIILAEKTFKHNEDIFKEHNITLPMFLFYILFCYEGLNSLYLIKDILEGELDKPDVIFYVDTPGKIAYDRILARGDRTWDETSRMRLVNGLYFNPMVAEIIRIMGKVLLHIIADDSVEITIPDYLIEDETFLGFCKGEDNLKYSIYNYFQHTNDIKEAYNLIKDVYPKKPKVMIIDGTIKPSECKNIVNDAIELMYQTQFSSFPK